jgi:predicted transcriptional regulator
MAPDDRNVTRAELNGSLNRIEQTQIAGFADMRKEITDGFNNVYNKIDERIDREQDKREECAKVHDQAISDLEKCVGTHDQKLKLPGWAWKGFAALVGVTAIVFEIILAVKVLAH